MRFMDSAFGFWLFFGGHLFIFCLICFQRVFGVATLEKAAHDDFRKLASAIYLQVSTISQALIFVTRSRSWSYLERPGLLLVAAFIVAQLVSRYNHLLRGCNCFCSTSSSMIDFCVQIATLIAVYASWSFAAIEGIGWGWAGVIWLYNIIFYIPLDFIKFFIRYALSGRAWDLVIEQRVSTELIWFLELINPRLVLYFIFFSLLINCMSCRLLSQGKRTLGRNRGNFNGHMHKGRCMDYNHPTLRCSPRGHMSLNSIKWRRKLKGEPKSQGIYTPSITNYFGELSQGKGV